MAVFHQENEQNATAPESTQLPEGLVPIWSSVDKGDNCEPVDEPLSLSYQVFFHISLSKACEALLVSNFSKHIQLFMPIKACVACE